MTALVVGLDQGTSSTRCVALDAELRELGAASVPVASSFPAPGLVEQDPEALAAAAGRGAGGGGGGSGGARGVGGAGDGWGAGGGGRPLGGRRGARHGESDRDVRRLGA